MATKKKPAKTTPTPKKAEFQGFFSPVLNADIKKAVKSLPLGDTAVLERVHELTSRNFKLSIVPDKDFTHLTFSLFDKRADSNSQGYVLSVKHSDLSVGITLLWFLVFEIYEDGGWMDWIKGTTDLDW